MVQCVIVGEDGPLDNSFFGQGPTVAEAANAAACETLANKVSWLPADVPLQEQGTK